MSNTYIVDGNSLLFRGYYSTAYTGNLMTNKDGIPTNAIFAFHNLIKKIKSGLKEGDHMFVAFDTGHKTKRKEQFEDYKAQRSPVPEELIAQMPIARELLTAMNIFHDEIDGYEGDDLAGSMAKYAVSKGDTVVLFSSDKDFLQLLDLSDNIHVCFLKKGLTETIDYTKNNLIELFGLNPDQVTDFKGIAGDSSDNYKGIKGVGEKTAMKLLTEHGHLEEILEYCRAKPEVKLHQKILDGEKDALFFKQLATIDTDMDMREDYEKSIYKPYYKSTLRSFYTKYQLNQFLMRIDKMDDMIDDMTGSQLSLFEDSEEGEEVEETKLQLRETQRIKAIAEIPERILGFTYDADKENENIAKLFGFAYAGEKKIYLQNLCDAREDPDFIPFLQREDKDLSVYDLKGILVLLNRNNFPELKGVTFDMLIATYLINPDYGQKRDALFMSYDIPLDKGLNIPAQVISHTIDLRDSILATLKEHQEMDLFMKVELPLSVILAKMEIEGFPMNAEVLSEIDEEYKKILSALEREIYDLAGREFNINSPKQLEEVLFTDLGIKRYKGEKGTGIEVLQSHQEDHPVVKKVIVYRLYKKLVSGYTESLPSHLQSDHKIHALFNQALTSTGRLSMSEPNLQNISIRNEEGKNIRKAFFYPEHEYSLLSLDYSQVELRVLASVGKIKALKEIFAEGEDIHRATASRVFNVPLAEVTSEMRRRAKAVNFGIVYGISSYGLSVQLDISREEASQLIKQFKQTFQGIDEFQESAIEMAREKGYVCTLLNRRRYLKDINASNRALRAFSERAAVNTIIQGTAADLIKVAMIKIDELLKNYKTKLILQIHDELIFKVPKEEIGIIESKIKEVMEKALDLSVPLKVDGQLAENWYEAH